MRSLAFFYFFAAIGSINLDPKFVLELALLQLISCSFEVSFDLVCLDLVSLFKQKRAGSDLLQFIGFSLVVIIALLCHFKLERKQITIIKN